MRVLDSDLLACPDCHTRLVTDDAALRCDGCHAQYPVYDGIPILLGRGSIFSAAQILKGATTFFAHTARENQTKRAIRRGLPSLMRNSGPRWTHPVIAEAVRALPADAIGLDIGTGQDAEELDRQAPGIRWVHSDVDLAYRPTIVADATGLPAPDDTYDVVYAEQVLEHVVDIQGAARELQRVCKVGGVIVVGIPFVHPYHGAPYDFYRVTPSGLRVLFAQTECLHLGPDSGNFSALAIQANAALVSVFRHRYARMAMAGLARVLFSGLKYADRRTPTLRHFAAPASLLYVGRKVAEPKPLAAIMDELRAIPHR